MQGISAGLATLKAIACIIGGKGCRPRNNMSGISGKGERPLTIYCYPARESFIKRTPLLTRVKRGMGMKPTGCVNKTYQRISALRFESLSHQVTEVSACSQSFPQLLSLSHQVTEVSACSQGFPQLFCWVFFSFYGVFSDFPAHPQSH